jgi:hypothetical protein
MTNSLLTAGTATATNGSATVTGSGTVWASTVRPGMLISFGSPYSDWYQVTAVASDTSLTINTNFTGTTGSYGYGILPWFATEADAATRISNDLLTLLESYGTIFNVSGASKTQEFNKTSSGGDAGQILSQGGTKQFRFGLFGDNVYRLQRTTDGTNWTTVYSVDKTTGAVTVAGTWTMPAVTLTDVNTGPLGGLRNLLVNGSMDIWQRGTSGFASGAYAADRWLVLNTTSASRSTDVPDARFLYSIEYAHSSASYPMIRQFVEAANCRHLVGKKARLSFWAKNVSGSSTIYIEINSANAADNFGATTYVGGGTVSASPSSSWVRYSYDLGTIPSGVANGIVISIIRSNASASTTRVTGVQLEIGDVATNYEFVGERGGIAAELARCQRYYQVLSTQGLRGQVSLTTSIVFGRESIVEMRADPTVSLLRGDFAAGSFDMLVGGSWVSSSGLSIVSPSVTTRGQTWRMDGFSGLTLGGAAIGNIGTAAVAFSAEL